MALRGAREVSSVHATAPCAAHGWAMRSSRPRRSMPTRWAKRSAISPHASGADTRHSSLVLVRCDSPQVLPSKSSLTVPVPLAHGVARFPSPDASRHRHAVRPPQQTRARRSAPWVVRQAGRGTGMGARAALGGGVLRRCLGRPCPGGLLLRDEVRALGPPCHQRMRRPPLCRFPSRLLAPQLPVTCRRRPCATHDTLEAEARRARATRERLLERGCCVGARGRVW